MLEWQEGKTKEGRPVWSLIETTADTFPQGWVVDYSPGTPPYHAHARVPWTKDKWFTDLNEAKDWVTVKVTLFYMGEEYTEEW